MNFRFLILTTIFVSTLSFLPDELKRYQVIAGTTITNSGTSRVHGDMALHPGTSITGFPPGEITGKMEINNPTALLAQTSLIKFYLQTSLLPCEFNLTGVDIGGKTLTPGVYCFTQTVAITGTVTLDAQNKTAPLWIFQIGTTLTTAGSSIVSIINGTNTPCNIFWNVGSSVTLGESSKFKGIINAYTSISISTTANIEGKLFAQNGAVTLLTNDVSNCTEVINDSFQCFGLNSTDSKVCGGHGKCTKNNSCFCNVNYQGTQCGNFTCFSIDSTNVTVCGGNGICNLPNNCTCNAGFTGNQCQNQIGASPKPSPKVSPVQSPKLSPIASPKVSPKSSPIVSPIVSPKLSPKLSPKVSPKVSPIASPKISPKISPKVSPKSSPVASPKVSPKSSNIPSNSPKLSNAPITSTTPKVSPKLSLTPIASPRNSPNTPSGCPNKMTILSGTTITSTGLSTITGNIGVYPGSGLTGFPPAKYTGDKYIAVSSAQTAQGELGVLYGHLTRLPCNVVMTGVNLGSKTLVPGVYCFATGAEITGNLYLDSANQTDPYWIFQMGTTLVTSSSSKVLFTKDTKPCKVFWKVGSSATIGGNSIFNGNIVAYTSISLDTSASVTGKLLAQNGEVTLISNTIVDCPFNCTNSCYGIESTNPSVCSGKGTCTVLGTCDCQNGFNGTKCETMIVTNSSSGIGFSLISIIISFLLIIF